MTEIWIGIDPGTKTGVAIWDSVNKVFIDIRSLGAYAAMMYLSERLATRYHQTPVKLIFEDSRKRKWLGNKGPEALQGAGSIKRDCSLWEEFCEYHDIDYEAIPPQAGLTKWSQDYFKNVTKWQKRTNEHSRDAGCLVFGK